MYFIFIFENWLLIKEVFNKENLIKASFNKTVFDASIEALKPYMAKWVQNDISENINPQKGSKYLGIKCFS